MSEIILIIGGILAAIISTVTIACFLFYTKQQIDEKFDTVGKGVTNNFNEVTKTITNNKLENQKNSSNVKDEIYEKLNENKKALEEGMKQFITILSDIKEADKDMSLQFITMINTVKEELKNDYTSRYNDLLLLINTKANITDFNRLESKFDKMSETMIELKTTVEMKLKEDSKKTK